MSFNNIFYVMLFFVFSIQAMEFPQESSYHYRQAQENDVDSLVEFFNTEIAGDCDNFDKLVILPPAYRQASIESSIKKKRVFLAEKYSKIVGLQKQFLVDDPKECEAILCDEIRCKDRQSYCAGRMDLKSGEIYLHDNCKISFLDSDVYIYLGGSFTVRSERGMGVNKMLTGHAFTHLQKDILEVIAKKTATKLCLLFGLVKANAGSVENPFGGRSHDIITITKNFITESAIPATQLYAYRYPSFMPKFDQEAQECVPLPDEQSVPGFGCVLVCDLNS